MICWLAAAFPAAAICPRHRLGTSGQKRTVFHARLSAGKQSKYYGRFAAGHGDTGLNHAETIQFQTTRKEEYLYSSFLCPD